MQDCRREDEPKGKTNVLWFDLACSAASYAICRLPVGSVAGAAEIEVNLVLHRCVAVAIMPGARLDLAPGVGHMLYRFHKNAAIQSIRKVARAAGRS